MNNKNEIFKQHQLTPHPEGGYFGSRKSWLMAGGYEISSIIYFLEKSDCSFWHKLNCDEIWSYHKGSHIILMILNEKGKLSKHILGNSSQRQPASFQVLVKAGQWFAAELLNKESFSLVSCLVYPSFSYENFELADPDLLIKKFPQHKFLISRLYHQYITNKKL